MHPCAAAPMRRSADALLWQFRTCGVLARASPPPRPFVRLRAYPHQLAAV